MKYVMKRVGERWVVLDATTPKTEPAPMLGTFQGDASTGYTIRRPDGTVLDTFEPIYVADHAAQVLYLEHLFTLTPTTTGDAS